MRCKGGWSGPIVVVCPGSYVSRWLTGHLAMFTRRYSALITALASPSPPFQIRFRGQIFLYRIPLLEENLIRLQDRFENTISKLNHY